MIQKNPQKKHPKCLDIISTEASSWTRQSKTERSTLAQRCDRTTWEHPEMFEASNGEQQMMNPLHVWRMASYAPSMQIGVVGFRGQFGCNW